MEIEELIESVSHDMFNPIHNFNIGMEYEKIGQSAAATSFYLRAAEYGFYAYPILVYNALLRISFCVEDQSGREHTLENCLLQAIAYLPKRPEAYFLLSKFYEKKGEWQHSFTYASIGLLFAEKEIDPLPISVNYYGSYVLKFQKALSGWWIGRSDSSKEEMLELAKLKDIDSGYRYAIVNNLKNLGISQDKIAIVLPVRDQGTGRAKRVMNCILSWQEYTEGLSDIHIIIDEDDTQYFDNVFANKDKLFIHVKQAGLTLMQKINTVGVDVADIYKYVCFIGDDITFKTKWESEFINYLSSVPAGVIGANTLDNNEPDKRYWSTHPCITSNLIKAVGFYGCPAVHHNFFDVYWADVAKEIGYNKYMPEIIMDHRKDMVKMDFEDSLYIKAMELQKTDKPRYEDYKRLHFYDDIDKIREAIPKLKK
jgi:hypothetical protein